MQVSLRKANALQKAIEETINTLKVDPNVSLNEFQSESTVDSLISSHQNNIDLVLERRNNLLDALYEIRQEVSNLNTLTSISQKLNQLARYTRDIVFYTTLTKAKLRTESDVLKGKLTRMRERKEVDLYGRDMVETSVFTTTDINGFVAKVASLKKAKQKLQDELLELNVSTVLTLSENTVKTLTSENLI